MLSSVGIGCWTIASVRVSSQHWLNVLLTIGAEAYRALLFYVKLYITARLIPNSQRCFFEQRFCAVVPEEFIENKQRLIIFNIYQR